MELTAKILSLVILFVVSITFGIIPYFLLKWLSRKYFNSPRCKEVISTFNCFSGGVFFATSFLAILPEARGQMERLLHRLSTDIEFPLTEALLGIGFLSILLIENITMTCCYQDKDGMYEELDDDPSKQTYGSTNGISDTNINGESRSVPEKGTNTDKEDVNSLSQESDISCHEHVLHVQDNGITNIRSIVLVLALSIHMIFDGLELGLLDSEPKVWSVLLALCIHKSLIFFSVGLTLSETLTNTKIIFLVIFIMAAVSPIGGSIGIVLMTTTHGVVARTLSAFLQGIAVGTFIYVTFFEILLREFNKKIGGGVNRSIAVIYGFGLFAILRYVESDISCHEHVLHVQDNGITNIRSIVLVLALSIHMIFDGLELGLLDSEPKVWSVLLALCIHKSLIFFSVGLTLCETLTNTKIIFLVIFIMAAVSPIGGSIGIVLMTTTHGVVARTLSAFLQGIVSFSCKIDKSFIE